MIGVFEDNRSGGASEFLEIEGPPDHGSEL
jgi:hypothetical protein